MYELIQILNAECLTICIVHIQCFFFVMDLNFLCSPNKLYVLQQLKQSVLTSKAS